MAEHPGSDFVDELHRRFDRVDASFGPVPIWWWSGARLERARLRWQMEQLVAHGVHQAVVMCLAPRGPIYGALADDPPFLSEPWWRIFLDACADAEEIGFRFWLYDQFGFSGANFQGQLVAAQPARAGHELARVSVEVGGQSATLRCPEGGMPVGGYVVPEGGAPVTLAVEDGAVAWNAGPAQLHLVYARRRGFNYFDAEACHALLDTVLGAFDRRAARWFGNVIVGLFQDELPDMPTWGATFAGSFRQTVGYDLCERIAHLYEDGGPEGLRVRRDYHAHRGALGARAFFEPLAAWANGHGLVAGFDQQSPAREGDPAGEVRLYGDYLATHAGFTAPGNDHWGDPKIHSSLAHAHGRPRTWLEAFHSSGWGGTLEGTYDWLGPFLRRGSTLYDPHAVYYSTAGGWWEWAPPSTCWRQPYWADYGVFAAAVTRLCSVLTLGELVADTVLLHPTVSTQAHTTLPGLLPAGETPRRIYHELNGATAWYEERPGVLDRSGVDYEVFDDATLAVAEIEADTLRLAGGAFRNVVLPGVDVLDARLAGLLGRFALAGGTVLAIGSMPATFLGDDRDADAFRDAVTAGRVTTLPGSADVPAALATGPLTARADVPFLLRRHGDAVVLLLVAHDDRTGTQAPILPGQRDLDWVQSSFRFDEYWTQMARKGYTFVPVGDRVAEVALTGVGGLRAQRWDPRSGITRDLDPDEMTVEGDSTRLRVSFEDGPMALVVLAPCLPEPGRTAPGPVVATQPLDGRWRIEIESSLDNRWGDLGDRSVTGTIPLQVWRLHHTLGRDAGTDAVPAEDGTQREVRATFGPYVLVRGPQPHPSPVQDDGDAAWQPAEYSLSRGIHNDPRHFEFLGPKGWVPEEFLCWPTVRAGEWVAFRTYLPAASTGHARQLVIGANAERTVRLAGHEVLLKGAGYWTSTLLPDSSGPVALEVWLRAGPDVEDSGQHGVSLGVRASFAVVNDLARFHRPEWLVPADGSRAASVVELTRHITLDGVPSDARIQIAAEGACSVHVNGVEIGRQGAFEPYAVVRSVRVQPYDISSMLRPGPNELTVRMDDAGRCVALLVDSGECHRDGLGVVSDLEWTARRDGRPVDLRLRREQWGDPRWVCLTPRPHPLPQAAWLDPAGASGGVVEDVVPDAYADGPGVEWLSFTAPVGTTRLRIPTDVPFTAWIDGHHKAVDETGSVALDEPVEAGTPVSLRFTATTGRRAGALLLGPVEVETAPATAPLLDWAELGLRSLGGAVTYQQDVRLESVPDGGRVTLDLGDVRGTAEVRVNAVPVATLVWSPYRADVTAALRPGRNTVSVTVRGTLAGYLDDASPTPAVAAGQTRAGLYGPVRLLHHAPRRVRGSGTAEAGCAKE